MASKTFTVPFADSGDKTAVPDPTQPAGAVSYTEGFPIEYELDQVTEPTALDVPRQETNQLWFDVTEFLQELQQNGLSVYNATYNYAVGARTIASDGILYRALLVNGPASTVRNPVGDTSGTWLSNRGDVRSYSATFDYALTSFVKGSDGLLYRADIVNGPTTSVVGPVGDLTGTWVLLTVIPSADPIKTTVFTASDPTWAPDAATKALKVTVTGAGGGGGGIDPPAGPTVVAGVGGSGGAGGSAILTVNGVIASTYAVVVGAAGSAGAAGASGGAGGDSTFNGTGIGIVTGSGGSPGAGSVGGSGYSANAGGGGGSASGGDISNPGGDGGHGVSDVEASTTGRIFSFGGGGGSFWGGGPSGVFFDSNGATGISKGVGGSGAASATNLTPHTGGAGAPGVVVVEEYF